MAELARQRARLRWRALSPGTRESPAAKRRRVPPENSPLRRLLRRRMRRLAHWSGAWSARRLAQRGAHRRALRFGESSARRFAQRSADGSVFRPERGFARQSARQLGRQSACRPASRPGRQSGRRPGRRPGPSAPDGARECAKGCALCCAGAGGRGCGGSAWPLVAEKHPALPALFAGRGIRLRVRTGLFETAGRLGQPECFGVYGPLAEPRVPRPANAGETTTHARICS